MHTRPLRLLPAMLLLVLSPCLHAADHFLVIGGGNSPANNQVSLEKNVLYFNRVLADLGIGTDHLDVYFADGRTGQRDLQFQDARFEPPPANLLLAQLAGRSEELYYKYRPHKVPNLRGAATRADLEKWFADTGAKLADHDRLVIYFTGHGGKGNPARNTTLELWGENPMPVREFVNLLDRVPPAVPVVLIMVQCHAGGFADLIFSNAQPPQLSPAPRAGFFATVPERPAAGCTADILEENYHEYSTYFMAALCGKTRLGDTIDKPDYNADGQISFAEAHAYAQIESTTIDIPISTSDVFLRQFGKLNPRDINSPQRFDDLVQSARSEQRAVIDGLWSQLGLHGPRFAAVKADADRIDRERKSVAGIINRMRRDYNRVRSQLRDRVRYRWPETANAWHPDMPAILKEQGDAIVRFVESQPQYRRWQQLASQLDDLDARSDSLERRWVKCQRFLYVAESIALAASLDSTAPEDLQQRYRDLLLTESGVLKAAAAPGAR